MNAFALFFISFLFTIFLQAHPTCDHITTTIMPKGTIHECTEFLNWPTDKMKLFCNPVGQEGAPKGTAKLCSQSSCTCPAGSSFVCKNITSKNPSLPKEYFDKMPKEMADQVRANMARAKNPFTGLKMNLYYYPSDLSTPEVQKLDCKNKGGTL